MPDFFRENDAAVAVHLQILQGIIERLANNSAQCKTWCLTLVTALIGLAGALKNYELVSFAVIPLIIFALLDAAYLAAETSYRNLYNGCSAKLRNNTYGRCDLFNATPAPVRTFYFSALWSWSVWPVYAGLALAIAATIFVDWPTILAALPKVAP